MKRFLARLLALVLIVGALALAIRPVAVRQYRLWQGAKAVSAYQDAAKALDDDQRGERLARARRYNDTQETVEPREGAEPDDAQDALDALALNGDGVLAVLTIPKLGATLPVYRGGDGARELGAVHLAGSSLPVGGDGTCCVLAGQSNGGFAGLDRLIPGDCFSLEALEETLVYQVERVTDAPADMDAEADVCALTAADRGGAQLLVRARRISRREAPLADDTYALPGWAARTILAAPVALAGLIALAVIETLRRALRRRRLKRVRL